MNSGTSRFLNWLIVLLGVAQIVSPFFLGIIGFSAVVNGLVVGVLLVVLGVWAAVARGAGTARTLDTIIAIVGAWLIAAPIIMGYANLANGLLRSPILIGLIVLILAVLAVMRNNRAIARVDQETAAYGQGIPISGAGQPNHSPTAESAPNAPNATMEAEPPAAAGEDQAENTALQGGETETDQTPPQSQATETSQGNFSGVGPQGYQRPDAQILDDIVERLTQEDHLDASNIQVNIQKGDVVLSGSVPTVVEQHLAEETTLKVMGVNRVHNDLHVGDEAQTHPTGSASTD